jgi:hypothetical protein
MGIQYFVSLFAREVDLSSIGTVQKRMPTPTQTASPYTIRVIVEEYLKM